MGNELERWYWEELFHLGVSLASIVILQQAKILFKS